MLGKKIWFSSAVSVNAAFLIWLCLLSDFIFVAIWDSMPHGAGEQLEPLLELLGLMGFECVGYLLL